MKLQNLAIALVLAVAPLTSSSLLAGDMEQNLVARWTFKDGSLKSDIGDFTFQEGDRGSMETGADSVTLLERKVLICSQLNNTALPKLQKNVTIWARFKFNELPGPSDADAGVLGLMKGAGPGTWRDFTFVMLHRQMAEDQAHRGLAFLGRTLEAGDVGIGVTRYQPIQAGEWVNAAIVYNLRARTAGMWVSATGKWVESKIPPNAELQDFGSFLIGKLMVPGSYSSITFDEVRVYSTALDAQWLEEITPVESK